MKKILFGFCLVSIAQLVSAQVIGGGLTGTATRMLQVNSSGELIPLAPGSSSQVLFGNGVWGSPPWSNNGGNTIFNTGNVGIGNSNPQVPLDVTGDGRFSGTLSTGSFITTGDINLNHNLRFGNQGILSYTTGAASLGTFGLNSNTQIAGSLNVGQDISFGNGGNINYTPATTTSGDIFSYGRQGNPPPPAFYPCTLNPYLSSIPSHNFQGTITTYGYSTNGNMPNVLTMGFDGINGFVDMAGVNGSSNPNPKYLINYYCGKDVAICTGTGNGNNSGQGLAGGFVFTGPNLQIGSVSQNRDASTALNIGTNNSITSAINVNSSGSDVFKVEPDGSITSASIAGGTSTYRQLLADQTGKIIAGGSIQNQNSQAWILGGNSTTSNATLGTSDGSDLPFITGSGTEKIRIKANGRIGISTTNPNALFHINTHSTGNVPGIIVDDANPVPTDLPEFIVNSDGSTVINSFQNSQPPFSGIDPFNINIQFYLPFTQQHLLTNALRVGFNPSDFQGHVGIGSGGQGYLIGQTPVVSSIYKTLTVNGDVSLANYNTAGSGNLGDGYSALEILGYGEQQIPTRRGITVDSDPNGDFYFYLNSNQISSEFKFMNGVQAGGFTQATSPANAQTLMTIASNGKVNIGTKKPAVGQHDNSLLSVYGDITTTAVYITDPNDLSKWPDFVFEKNYKLMPLQELEKFYSKNKHLPDVPSAQEIKDNGNNLGETDRILLQKTEENTLYIVQLNKKIEEQEKLITELKKQLDTLSKINK